MIHYTEELKYQTRPNPDGERFFGVIGTTGLKVRVYPGVVLKVEEMMLGSPSEGKFAKGEILTGDDDVLHLSRAEALEDQSATVALLVSGILRRRGGQCAQRHPAILALKPLG